VNDIEEIKTSESMREPNLFTSPAPNSAKHLCFCSESNS
jgi:hypothetical protein